MGQELGVDPTVILATSHGRRSIDVLKIYDEKKANWEFVSEAEGRIPREFGQDAIEIPGARKLLASLDSAKAPWAVVTSGTGALINGWVGVMKLTPPEYLVTAEDVKHGKPDPECYLLGRSRLGLENKPDFLVVEDAPSGVRAGKAAGFKVIGLLTTHSLQQIGDAGADWIVKDLRDVMLKSYDASVVQIEMRNTVLN